MPDSGIAAMLAAAGLLLRSLGDPGVEDFMALWPAAPRPARALAPRGLPVLSWLGSACGAGGPPAVCAVLAALRAASPALAWSQTYSVADIGGDFLDRYGWTELIGQRGPVASERLAAGFLLLGPQVEYPPHSHDAEEIYVPLSGRAEWQRGGAAWQARAPGTPIYHASRVAHAMRTAAEPLLALYLWRGGDLTQKSRLG